MTHGLMQDYPLTIDRLFRRAEDYFGHKSIVSVEANRQVVTTYREWAAGTRQLAGSLDALGIPVGARVGSFAWNSARHLQMYFGVPGARRVLHCINIRLSAEQIVFVINHAEDDAIFVDRSLLGVLGPLLGQCPTVRHVVVMDDGPDAGEHRLDGVAVSVHDYDELVAASPSVDMRVKDENTAAAMCYTSGTTGDPKGVVYTHRSVYLHTMAAGAVATLGINEADRILPLVPMFHANAWGIPHAAIAQGADLVLPGSDLSGPRVADLLVDHGITMTAGVPTIWTAALPHLRGRDTSALRLVACGGAAVPIALSEAFRVEVGLPLQQAWGMTETSPLAAVARLDRSDGALDEHDQADLRAGVGRATLGVEARIVEAGTDRPVPHDGDSRGELQVAGPWIASGYFHKEDDPDSFTTDGWLRTGDVATMDARGWIRLVDRTKDLIKSGGEWISSVDLENELMNHPTVLEAAVVGVPHERWTERPIACVVPAPGSVIDVDDLLGHLTKVFPKWQLPEKIIVLDAIPKTSVGKFSKVQLREQYRDALVRQG
ncbi:long-chain fatty acid--CoA ligase [Gordonia rubripertincta]|uniref:Long-chain fatty acid--CoA ligase n=1 Tax=Gordonia rubripertincta TaxID=36822 RepID=A0ABT4MVQ1_GORRU|nr:long-chain fatty acid--CoA ligase [Gordonia rubripertincta]MCZ4551088.1 long-chain fatty acid--CoA ligase [Gordonia rubripertincta]